MCGCHYEMCLDWSKIVSATEYLYTNRTTVTLPAEVISKNIA